MYSYDEFKSKLVDMINEYDANTNNWLGFVAKIIVFIGYASENIASITNKRDTLIGEAVEFFFSPESGVAVFHDGILMYEIPLSGAIHESTIIAIYERNNGSVPESERVNTAIREILNNARNSEEEILAYFFARCFDPEEMDFEKGKMAIQNALNTYVECEVANAISLTLAKTNAVIVGGKTPARRASKKEKTTVSKIEIDPKEALDFVLSTLSSPDNPYQFEPVVVDNSGYIAIRRNENKRSWVCKLYLGDRKKFIVFNDETRAKIPFDLSEETQGLILESMKNVFLN